MISNKSKNSMPTWYSNYGNKLFESNLELILEQKKSSISELVASANETDSEEVKGTAGYAEVMAWYSNEGPSKGKPDMESSDMVKCMEYWTGDLSSETGKNELGIEQALGILSAEDKLAKLLNKLDKQRNNFTPKDKAKLPEIQWDKPLIIQSAKKLQAAFSELHKSGKKIGNKTEGISGNPTRYSVATTLNDEQYPFKLGIIPFGTSSDGIETYNGKDIGSNDVKMFHKWYNSINNDLDKMMTYLDLNSENGSKVIKTNFVSIEDRDKIAMLTKFSDRAKRKVIADALKIRWWPQSAKTITSKEKMIIEGVPETNYMEYKFPADTQIAKTFFVDDASTIDPKFSNSINEFVQDIRQQIPKDAEITSVKVMAVASTSTVPSTKYRNEDGNVTLVAHRLKAINDATALALTNNNLNSNVEYVPGGGLPNQGAEWVSDDAKWGPQGNRNALYETTFGEHRFSGVQITVGWKVTTQEPDEGEISTIEITGKWSSTISWRKHKNPPGFPPIKFPPIRRKNNGTSPLRGGTSCMEWCNNN